MRNHWEGRRVRLRAIDPDDWEQFYRWSHDSYAQRNAYQIETPRSREDLQEWAREQAQRRRKGDDVVLAVERNDAKLVGSVTAEWCEPRHGTFMVNVALGREHWSNGYAREAMQVLLHHYFTEMRYQKANARVYAFNDRSQRLFEALGFQEEGRIRSAYYGNGQFHDVLLYGITVDEFREHHAELDAPHERVSTA